MIVLLGLSAIGVAAAPPAFRRIAGIEDPELREISGLAPSRERLGEFWMVNDSGHDAVLYRVGLDGRTHQRVALRGADNADWEDLALFQWRGASWLAIGDIGDNLGWRRQVTIYLLPEPPPAAREASVVHRIDFRYPGGALDAEAMAVDPARERILVLEKAAQGAGLYALPLAPPPGARVQAELLGRLGALWPGRPAALVVPLAALRARGAATSMDLTADGRRLLLLTYRHAFVFERAAEADWPEALARPGTHVAIPGAGGFEAAAFDPDGRSVWIVNESRGTPQLFWHRPPDAGAPVSAARDPAG